MFISAITVVNPAAVQLNTTMIYDKKFETKSAGVISP
jgi:hypothetical protein